MLGTAYGTNIKSRLDVAAVALLLTLGPVGGGGWRSEKPAGRREGSRRFRRQHMDVLSAEPGRRPQTFRATL